MSPSPKRQIAEQTYNTAKTLFEEGHYEQALRELDRAEDAFRKLDARGHPLVLSLPNGITGLANTLALKGLCYLQLGDCAQAVHCFETCLINAPFERERHFARFFDQIRGHLIACYEEELRKQGPTAVETALQEDPVIETAFAFPYSLAPGVIPLARLYELAPARYQHVKDFYQRARKKDRHLRRIYRTGDETTIRHIALAVWGIMAVLWLVYGIVVLQVLLKR